MDARQEGGNDPLAGLHGWTPSREHRGQHMRVETIAIGRRPPRRCRPHTKRHHGARQPVRPQTLKRAERRELHQQAVEGDDEQGATSRAPPTHPGEERKANMHLAIHQNVCEGPLLEVHDHGRDGVAVGETTNKSQEQAMRKARARKFHVEKRPCMANQSPPPATPVRMPRAPSQKHARFPPPHEALLPLVDVLRERAPASKELAKAATVL